MQKNIVLNSHLSVKSTKRLITITVVGCQGLKVPYGDIAQVAPFFFYQFYTFDDRYSHNGSTTNPRFNDTQSYEVLFDAKAIITDKTPRSTILSDFNTALIYCRSILQSHFSNINI